MKKALFIAALVLGSVLVISVVAPIVYVYASRNYVRSQIQASMEAAQQRSAITGGATIVDAATGMARSMPPSPPQVQSGSVLADVGGDKTENNYLGRVIIDEILRQTYFARHPSEPIPLNFREMITVNDGQHYDIEVFAEVPTTGFVQLQLQPQFLWDAACYTPVVQAMLGDSKAEGSDPKAEECLADLLEPTGAKLASEDVRLSAELQQHPLDAQAHEEAALVLLSLALRENADDYSDIRLLLCRATAHLSIADVLVGNASSWNNRIADVTLRVISGRETDAKAILDDFASRSDCPAAVKSWIDALRIWNKQDVTGATVTAASPRLVKIAWFQTLARNQPLLSAVDQLKALGPPDRIVDWTRALMACHEGVPVEIGNEFCQPALAIEYEDLDGILAAEKAPAVDQGHLSTLFGEMPAGTVVTDENGHGLIHVVGLGTFKAATRHHVFQTLETTYNWLKNTLGDPEGTKTFVGQTLSLYRGVPFFEEVAMTVRDDSAPWEQMDQALRREHKTWNIADVPPITVLGDLAMADADKSLANAYFLEGPPLGTTFNDRMPDILNFVKIGPDWHRDPNNVDPHVKLQLLFLQKAQAMHPDSLAIANAVLMWQNPSGDEALAQLAPFLKYNIHAFDYFDQAEGRWFHLTDLQKEDLLKARSVLDPNYYFTYGDLLFVKGRADDAAAAYRTGVAQVRDQVMMSNSVQNLVDYDYDHGNTKEAMDLASKAADVGSETGLMTYMSLLEKTGDLAGAEQQGIAIRDHYDNTGVLLGLYVRHPDKFASQAEAARQQSFPDGMVTVTLASFKDAPTEGVRIAGTSEILEDARMDEGDVIVALNGTRTDNEVQYDYVRAMALGPVLDLIVWSQTEGYKEVKASPPHHMFGVNFEDYHSP